MITFFMTLFVILCIILVALVLIQQGKGDMGLGSLGRGSQMLFGGSGGQDFFEKATWILGALFMFGALGITIWKTKSAETSRLAGYRAPIIQKAQPKKPAPTKPASTKPAPTEDAKQ